MKNSFPFSMTLLLFLAAGCYSEKQDVQELAEPEVMTEELTIQATLQADPETKTTRDPSNGDVLWIPGDAISLFYGSGTDGGSRFVSNATEPSKVTNFSGTITAITGGADVSLEDTYFWGVYPYSDDITCDGTAITMTIPTEQKAVAGTFNTGLFPSIGRSQGLIMGFYNVCGGWRFSVTKEGVRKVTLRSNGGEALTGRVKVGLNASGIPVIREVLEGSDEVVLECPAGEYFEVGQNYYMTILPGVLSSGLTMTFETYTEKGEYNRTASTTINRSRFAGITNIDNYLTTPYHYNTSTYAPFSIRTKEITLNCGETQLLVAETNPTFDGHVYWRQNDDSPAVEIIGQGACGVWADPYIYYLDYEDTTYSDPDRLTDEHWFHSVQENRETGEVTNRGSISIAKYSADNGDYYYPCIDKTNQYYGHWINYYNHNNNPEEIACSSMWAYVAAITALVPGTATFCAVTNDYSETCTITVPGVNVTGISFEQASLSIEVGDTYTMSAILTPADATCQTVSWTSSNDDVATVSSEGVISGLSNGATRITATTLDGGFTAYCDVTVFEVHEYVDLGLPSGIKWATCNVGASSPEELGDYFAYGETSTKSQWVWGTYSFGNGNYFTKYSTQYMLSGGQPVGYVDGKTILDLADDAANANWGGNWRVPTAYEYLELMDCCTWTWTTQNGVSGYNVTSSSNGNSIFLPAAGIINGQSNGLVNSLGYYMSSTLEARRSYWNCVLKFADGGVEVNSCLYRYYGFSVRPVNDELSKVPISRISIDESRTTIEGNSFYLYANLEPSSCTNPDVIWTSTNPEVARIWYSVYPPYTYRSIQVYTYAAGSTDIVATTPDGSISAVCHVTVEPKVDVTGVSLDQSSIMLSVGASATLTATVSPDEATNKMVVWTTSDVNVATVSSSGVVTAAGGGTATITATTSDGSYTATCSVRVTDPTPVNVVYNLGNIDDTALPSTYQAPYSTAYSAAGLTASEFASGYNAPVINTLPTGLQYLAGNDGISVQLNTSIASGAGSVIYTFTPKTAYQSVYPQISYTVQWNIVITDVPVTGVSLNKSAMYLCLGGTSTLTASVSPANATNQAVTWTSSNPTSVTVSSTGVVSAINGGSATITATTIDGGYTATCTVRALSDSYQYSISEHFDSSQPYSVDIEYWQMRDSRSEFDAIYDEPIVDEYPTGFSYLIGTNGLTVSFDTTIPSGAGSVVFRFVPKSGYQEGNATILLSVDWHTYVPVSSISISPANITIPVGSIGSPTAIVSPEDASDKSLTWSVLESAANAVTIVVSDGRVYGRCLGRAVIQAMSNDGSKTATCNVRVIPSSTTTLNGVQDIGSIEDSALPHNASIPMSNILNLVNMIEDDFWEVYNNPVTASTPPSGVSFTNTSSNISVQLTSAVALGSGSCGLVFSPKTAFQGMYPIIRYDIQWTVTQSAIPVTQVSINQSSLNLMAGQTATLTATVNPSNATNNNVSWSTSNSSVATVSSSGVVTANAAGSATITATTADGGYTASCSVRVFAASPLSVSNNVGTLDYCTLPRTMTAPFSTVYTAAGLTQSEFAAGYNAPSVSSLPTGVSYSTNGSGIVMQFGNTVALGVGSVLFTFTPKTAYQELYPTIQYTVQWNIVFDESMAAMPLDLDYVLYEGNSQLNPLIGTDITPNPGVDTLRAVKGKTINSQFVIQSSLREHIRGGGTSYAQSFPSMNINKVSMSINYTKSQQSSSSAIITPAGDSFINQEIRMQTPYSQSEQHRDYVIDMNATLANGSTIMVKEYIVRFICPFYLEANNIQLHTHRSEGCQARAGFRIKEQGSDSILATYSDNGSFMVTSYAMNTYLGVFNNLESVSYNWTTDAAFGGRLTYDQYGMFYWNGAGYTLSQNLNTTYRVTQTLSGVATLTDQGNITVLSSANSSPTHSNHNAIGVTSISLNQSSITLIKGETSTLTATVSPSNATDKSVTWTSTNPDAVSVSSSGVVSALHPGTATITATTNDGSFTATCSVRVIPASSSTVNITYDIGDVTTIPRTVNIPISGISAQVDMSAADFLSEYYSPTLSNTPPSGFSFFYGSTNLSVQLDSNVAPGFGQVTFIFQPKLSQYPVLTYRITWNAVTN